MLSPHLGVVAVLRQAPGPEADPRQGDLAFEADELRLEREALRARLGEIERRFDEIERSRHMMRSVPTLSAEEEDRRLRAAVWSGLDFDLALVEDRSRQLEALPAARARRAARADSDDDLRRRLEELDELARLEGARAQMQGPSAPYQAAVDERALSLRRRLAPFQAATAEDALAVSTHEIAVLAAVEPPEGPPTALALVLPVSQAIAAGWRERGDDLCARFAWRVVAALAGVLRDVGAADAPIRYDRLGDCLTIQAWLGDSELKTDLKERLSDAFDQIHQQAQELQRAQLDLFLAWVEPSVIAGGPPPGTGGRRP